MEEYEKEMPLDANEEAKSLLMKSRLYFIIQFILLPAPFHITGIVLLILRFEFWYIIFGVGFAFMFYGFIGFLWGYRVGRFLYDDNYRAMIVAHEESSNYLFNHRSGRMIAFALNFAYFAEIKRIKGLNILNRDKYIMEYVNKSKEPVVTKKYDELDKLIISYKEASITLDEFNGLLIQNKTKLEEYISRKNNELSVLRSRYSKGAITLDEYNGLVDELLDLLAPIKEYILDEETKEMIENYILKKGIKEKYLEETKLERKEEIPRLEKIALENGFDTRIKKLYSEGLLSEQEYYNELKKFTKKGFKD